MIVRGDAIIWKGLTSTLAVIASQLVVTLDTSDDDAFEIEVGDVFVTDIIEFDLETTYKMFGDFEMAIDVVSLILLYSTSRKYPLDSSGNTKTVRQFARVSVVDPGGAEYPVGQILGQSISSGHRSVFEQGWGEFTLSRIKISIFGNAFTKLKDIALNLMRAG